MMNARKRVASVALAILLGLAGVLGLTTKASAVSTQYISGQVNCGGYWVYYSTVRTTSGPGQRVDLYMTDFAGSKYGGYDTFVGAYIVALSKYLPYRWFSAYSPWGGGPLVPGGVYVTGTRFTLYASMNASVGVCDNVWGGLSLLLAGQGVWPSGGTSYRDGPWSGERQPAR